MVRLVILDAISPIMTSPQWKARGTILNLIEGFQTVPPVSIHQWPPNDT